MAWCVHGGHSAFGNCVLHAFHNASSELARAQIDALVCTNFVQLVNRIDQYIGQCLHEYVTSIRKNKQKKKIETNLGALTPLDMGATDHMLRSAS